MAELNPLSFAVAIKDEATRELERIESKLNTLKDQTIKIKIEGTEDLQKALNIDKLVEQIQAAKKALQGNSFDTFEKHMSNAAASVEQLTVSLGKFNTTLENDKGLKSYITGLGEVIQNVRMTMKQVEYSEKSTGKSGTQNEKLVTSQQRYNNMLADTEKLLSRIRDIQNVGGQTPLLRVASYDLSKFLDKAINVNTNDANAISNIIGEYRRLIKVYGEVAKEREKLIASDEKQNAAFSALKQRAEQQMASEEAARRHQKRLNDLTQAFAAYDAQVAKSQRITENENHARQMTSQTLRKQAEDLVRLRMEALRTQSVDLGKLLSLGRENLGAERYESVQTALRTVREEMRQIAGVMQNMDSYSSRELFNVGRGGMNFTPLINDTKKLAEHNREASKAVNQLTAEEQKLANAMSQTSSEANRQSQLFSDLKSLATQYLGVWGGQQFLRNVIEIGGQLEMQRLSIGAILGDVDKANFLFEQIKTKALKSPFGVVELDQMTKQLTAYGFQYNELYEMTMRLADISAATGTGVDRLALALGHVRSEAALSGYTLRQFSMANVPLLQKLSEKLGKTTKEIRAMVRTKDISYHDVIGVIKDLTNEGGMFYNAQEVMSESVKAKFKNLKDAFDIMYGEIAESFVGDALKTIANTLTTGAREWQKMGIAVMTVVGSFSAMRIATLAVNTALGKNTVATLANIKATLQRENANLRLLKASGNLTKAEFDHLKHTEKYSASSLKVALVTKKLSVEELQRAVILGKVKKEVAEVAVAQAGYNRSLIANLNVLSLWGKAGYLIGEGFRAAGMAVKSFLASVWPMLALTAVFEAIYHAIGQNTDAMEAGGEMAKKVQTKYNDLAKMNEKLGSSEGQSNEQLKEGVKEMQDALDKACLLTPELRNQVTETKNLTDKYNLLREALQGAATDFDELKARLALGLGESLKVGGGSAWNPLNWFRDNMGQDIKDYQKSKNKFDVLVNAEDVRRNIESFMKSHDLWRGGFAGMSGSQLFDQLSQEEKDRWINQAGWLELATGIGNGNISAAKSAYLKFQSDTEEISGEQGRKFAESIRDNYLNQLGKSYDWGNLTDDDRIEIDKQVRRALNGLPEADSATQEKLRDVVIGYLLGGNVPDYVKEVLKDMQGDGPEDEGGETEDANAKKLRERVRILKEAADSYKYWREKVGEEKAQLHVNEEFGKLLSDQGFSFENAEQMRDTLINLRLEYEKKPRTKEMLEALKEIDKELAELDRNEFEKRTEEFLSKTKIELDSLTRKWDMFNSVREATGNIDIAVQLSGAGYDGSKRNLADAIKEKIENDFHKAGAAIEFDLSMSDKQIEEFVQSVLPKASEERIAGLVEEYKKWRDLARDVYKSDVDVFTKNWNDEYDREEEFNKILAQYQKSKESLDSLLNQWLSHAVDSSGNRLGITQEQYDRALKNLNSVSNWDMFKARNNYKGIVDKADIASLQSVRKMIDAMREYSQTTHMNAAETEAWYEAMSKLTDREAVLDPLRAISDAAETYNAAVAARDAAKEQLRLAEMSPSELAYIGVDPSTVVSLTQAEQELELANQNIIKTWRNLQGVIEPLITSINQLGNSLQSLGTSIGGNMGDILNGFGSVFNSFGNSISAIKNIQNGEKGIVGVMNKVSAVMTVVSAAIEINKQLSNILPSSDNRYEQYAEKAREINNMREAVDDYALSVANARKEDQEWFAGTKLSDLRTEGEKAKDTLKAYYNELYEPQEIYKNKGSGISKWGVPIAAGIAAIAGVAATALTGGAAGVAILGAMATLESAVGTVTATAIGAAIAGGVGAAVGQIAQSAVQGIMYNNGQTSARNNMRIQTRHKSFWRGEKTQGLDEWVRNNLNAELFDNEGLVNLEAAQQVLEKYGDKLVGDTKDTLERLVELRKEYDDFIKQIEEYVGNIGSSLSDNMTDALWDWLANGEDALDKFKEYASDTWKSIAKDIVKTFMKVTVLDKYADSFKDLFKLWSLGGISDQNLISSISGLSGMIAQDFEASLPIAQKLAETLNAAFASQGYDIAKGSSGSSSGLSKSIQGMTEETSNLLASYLNATRADVSYIKQLSIEYFPMYYSVLTSSNNTLRSIENHTAAIVNSNAAIQASNEAVLSLINGLKNKIWQVPIS